jgi:dinuclear metal center YbgI/SA1388 family protein
MVRRHTLEKWLREYLDTDSIPDHLPNGLQVEGAEEVRRVLTAVSINLEVVQAAASESADTIIVHHGMFWSNEQRTVTGYRRRRLGSLLQGNINLFAYHLPLDLHPEISHNRLILEKLGAEVRQESAGKPEGRTGTFDPPRGFDELVKDIDRTLGARSKFFHCGTDRIGSLFVVSGAGRNFVDQVPDLDVDAYLTGDAAESTEYIAREEGLNYIFSGHYNTEKPGMLALGRKVQERFGIPVRFFDSSNPL